MSYHVDKKGGFNFNIIFCLYKVRIQKKKTQIQLARLCGLSQSHISELELFQEHPTFKSWQDISNALQVHPLDLIEFKE